MKIIDFERKGNLVRFYLGDDDLVEWYGDDWDDTPYEHNAERVYDEYIKGYCDMMFPFDDLVLEPCSGTCDSGWCKDDMVAQKKCPVLFRCRLQYIVSALMKVLTTG